MKRVYKEALAVAAISIPVTYITWSSESMNLSYYSKLGLADSLPMAILVNMACVVGIAFASAMGTYTQENIKKNKQKK